MRFDPRHTRLAFVDLETTGATITSDWITEIGIVEVDSEGVREWSSLVRPETRIPPFIEALTGISNEMVADAPRFEELAEELHARLDGCLFIAHNARFDHGFLKNAFRRAGLEFKPDVLCTVKLSRKLYPGYSRHNLDALIERHRLEVTQRHRALGDARLIWQFWQALQRDVPVEQIGAAVEALTARPSWPPHLDPASLDALPDRHGVYLFFDDTALPLYIGKANQLRRRVLSHFSGDHRSQKEMLLSQQVRRVEWIETAGEMGALMQEAILIKRLQPAHNHQLRATEEVCAWQLVQNGERIRLMLTHPDDLFFGCEEDLFGPFVSHRKATDALRSLVDAHQLCPGLLGLEKIKPGKPCFAHQVKRCIGACVGVETLAEHAGRTRAALASWRLAPWPHAAAIGIREGAGLHVVHRWRYLGSVAADDMDGACLLAAGPVPTFDRDVYQILKGRLARPDSAAQCVAI
ncbi:MAG: 3'-5' exoribonuclease [Herminiimonas sp.]|nr:3'-5' exoribonuclease [Herminiimonas sp.]